MKKFVGIITMSIITLSIILFQVSNNSYNEEIPYSHYTYLLRAKEALNDKELDIVIHNAKVDGISWREYKGICETIDSIMIKSVLEKL